MNTLELLESKYGIKTEDDAAPVPAPVAEARQPAAAQPADEAPAWKQSVPVVALSSYLKRVKYLGARVCLHNNGQLGLHFSPGLKGKGRDYLSRKRWAAASAAWILLCKAERDLVGLVEAGAINLPSRSSL